MNTLDQLKAYFAVDENGLRRCECINDSAIATEDVDDERDNGYVPDDMLPSKYFQIGCHKCDLEVIRDTKEEAIKAWNTRTSDPLIRSLLDELVKKDEALKRIGYEDFELGATMVPYGLLYSKTQCKENADLIKQSLTSTAPLLEWWKGVK